MHENLKYTVRLTKDIEACSDISDVKSIGIKDWQPIFADKEYETFYFLYAKFIGEKQDEKDSFEVQKIQLYLQNFEGDVTIGLTGKAYFFPQDLDFADHDSRFPERKQYGLFIILQGFNTKITTVSDHDLVFPKEGSWSSKPKIKTGDVLVTRVFFQPIPLNLRDASDNKLPCVLDKLFQVRDGDSIGYIERQDRADLEWLRKEGIMSEKDYDAIFSDLKENLINLAGVRRRCSPIISFFKVV